MARRNKKEFKKQHPIPIYLFVEGTQSEPAYFNLLKKKLGIKNLQVHSKMSKSNAASLITYAKKKITSDHNDLDENAKVYLVFDKDDLSKKKYQDIVIMSKNEGFEIGFSNVSFEVWLLAHYENMTKGLIDQKQLEKKLSVYLNQVYNKGDSLQLEKMVVNYENALKNTERINQVDLNFQCTTVGTMIEEIRGSRKK